jgi:hypothetical protein
VGLQTWGCAPILAELIGKDIERFRLDVSARVGHKLNEIKPGSYVEDRRGEAERMILGNRDHDGEYSILLVYQLTLMDYQEPGIMGRRG